VHAAASSGESWRLPSDPRVVQGAQTLDLDAVYRAHVQQVASWVARLAGPSADREDLVQEVFLVVERKLPSFRGDAKLSTWLYRITHNVVRSYWRKERILRWFTGARAADLTEVASSAPTPIEEHERRTAEALVYRALDGMAEKYRTVLILFELEGLPGQDIAELTGVKLGSVWVRLHRARQMFAQRIAAIEEASP
jgi:RNA polymerase sigma-70 factor (ECF subfamily)